MGMRQEPKEELILKLWDWVSVRKMTVAALTSPLVIPNTMTFSSL